MSVTSGRTVTYKSHDTHIDRRANSVIAAGDTRIDRQTKIQRQSLTGNPNSTTPADSQMVTSSVGLAEVTVQNKGLVPTFSAAKKLGSGP